MRQHHMTDEANSFKDKHTDTVAMHLCSNCQPHNNLLKNCKGPCLDYRSWNQSLSPRSNLSHISTHQKKNNNNHWVVFFFLRGQQRVRSQNGAWVSQVLLTCPTFVDRMTAKQQCKGNLLYSITFISKYLRYSPTRVSLWMTWTQQEILLKTYIPGP